MMLEHGDVLLKGRGMLERVKQKRTFRFDLYTRLCFLTQSRDRPSYISDGSVFRNKLEGFLRDEAPSVDGVAAIG